MKYTHKSSFIEDVLICFKKSLPKERIFHILSACTIHTKQKKISSLPRSAASFLKGSFLLSLKIVHESRFGVNFLVGKSRRQMHLFRSSRASEEKYKKSFHGIFSSMKKTLNFSWL